MQAISYSRVSAARLPAEIFGNLRVVLTVFIEAGNLAPGYSSPLVRLTVKHIGVNTTDREPLVVYPAPVVLQEEARPAIIVLCFERIPGYIECSVLVAKLRVWGGFNQFRIDFPCYRRITVEEEHVPVKSPCAAPAAEITPEPDLTDDRHKTFLRVCEKFG